MKLPQLRGLGGSSAIDLYVFIGLFINVYQLIKQKIRFILEKNKVLEQSADKDSEKLFFNKSEVS